MIRAPRRPAKLVLDFLVCSLPALCLAQTASEVITAEIIRLGQITETTTSENPNWQKLQPFAHDALLKAAADVEAGNLYLSLRRLEAVRPELLAFLFAESKTEDAAKGLEFFESEWRAAGVRLVADEQRFAAKVNRGTPAVVRAMAEVAWARSGRYYWASSPYAEAAGAEAGYHYLGKSAALLDFAGFLFALRFDDVAGAPPLRSIEPELRGLEQALIRMYQPPASIDRHDGFIGINATIKLARELNDSRNFHGAMYKYLEAVGSVEQFESVPIKPPSITALKEKLATYEDRLAQADVDHSIGQAFLQVAAKALEVEDNPQSLSIARSILYKVIPAYLDALEPGVAVPAAADDAVRVTLVRWPYT